MDSQTSETTSSTTDDEVMLRGVLDRWKSAVDAHEPAIRTSEGDRIAHYQVSKLG